MEKTNKSELLQECEASISLTWTCTMYIVQCKIYIVYACRLFFQLMWKWKTNGIRIITWMWNNRKSIWGLHSKDKRCLIGLRWSQMCEMIPVRAECDILISKLLGFETFPFFKWIRQKTWSQKIYWDPRMFWDDIKIREAINKKKSRFYGHCPCLP